MPEANLGNPYAYIVHAWDSSFLSLVHTLDSFYAARTHAGVATLLWLDIFALDQHTPADAKTLEAVGASVVAADTVAVAVDAACIVFTRTWCLYEIWVLMRTARPKQAAQKLQVRHVACCWACRP